MLDFNTREKVTKAMHGKGFRYRNGMQPVWRRVTPAGTVAATEPDVIALAAVMLADWGVNAAQGDLEAAMPALQTGLARVQTEARLLERR